MMRSSLFLVSVLVCGLVSAQPGGLPVRVKKLETQNDVLVKSRVAFAAALVDDKNWTSTEANATRQTLKFKEVITNIGNGYDPQTGIFTTPVKGLYFMQVTGISGSNGELHAGVKKNNETVFAIYQKAGTQAGSSNGAALALEKGDRLCVQLREGKTIADQGRLSIFTGFLVFPM